MLQTSLMKKHWGDLARIDVDFLAGNEYMGTATIEITDGNSVIIWDVEIDENHRGEGLGQKMMSEIIEFVYSNIMLTKKVGLFVRKDNLPAIKCYQKIGFKIVEKEYPKTSFPTLHDISYEMEFVR